MKRALVSLSFVVLSGCLEECSGEPSPVDSGPEVKIVSPKTGARVPVQFELEVTLSDFVHDRTVDGTVEVYVDRTCPARGEPTRDALPRAQFFDGIPTLAMWLDAGPHTLCVGLADPNGLAIGGVDLTSFDVVTSTAGPRVRITYPSQRATMVNGERMRFEVDGYVVRPRAAMSDTDDRFLFVVTDEPCLALGSDVDDAPRATRLEAGQLEHVVYLPPGPHTLCVGVADVEGRVDTPSASITIDVRY